MSELYLSCQPKAFKHQRVKTSDAHKPQVPTSFPSLHYFQVHFQYIHERADTAHQELADLKTYINRLESKLDTLMLLARQHKY